MGDDGQPDIHAESVNGEEVDSYYEVTVICDRPCHPP